METGSPSIAKVITMVLFALSCAGLLLFLWLSFGGTIPFNPQGYEFKVSFPNADQLATQADVRIAGVNVGKVVDKTLDFQHNRTIATIRMNNQYAPVREDAKAILRMKTILGETYVELTPGSPKAPAVPDGGLLPRGQVVNAVQLSDVFNALDPATRKAFQIWQQQLSKAVQGNDQNLNYVLGNLPTFAADASDILQVLDVEHGATVSLVQNGGLVFQALSQDQPALRNLITTGETVFHTTAQNQAMVSRIFQVFPTFLNETKTTMSALQKFSLNTDPLIRELNPVAKDLGPTLDATSKLSPYLRSFFYTLGPTGHGLEDRPARGPQRPARSGLQPAVKDRARRARPVPRAAEPDLQLARAASAAGLGLHLQRSHRHLGADRPPGRLGDFLRRRRPHLPVRSNGSSVPCGHYLRQFGPVGAETLSLYSNRDPNNRGNTYPPPLWGTMQGVFDQGDARLRSWDCKNTGAGGDGSVPADNAPAGGHPACWVAPLLPGAKGQYQIPHIGAASYSKK